MVGTRFGDFRGGGGGSRKLARGWSGGALDGPRGITALSSAGTLFFQSQSQQVLSLESQTCVFDCRVVSFCACKFTNNNHVNTGDRQIIDF